MASLVSGFEYDIFISYRQKDNEYDGWVTEFVKNLQRELHATFKEEISIYYDGNPLDGLLETYAVDESLVKKLHCLIFIPIISQTYCDPGSFAWKHELCSYNTLATRDDFGRDVRLASGNVASRILPVKIHELDKEDIALLESELGGVLRSVEFIYKSVGVNRPLRSNEDHPHDNLNNTYYRDQINKVANAIKEIINTLKKQIKPDKPDKPDTEHVHGTIKREYGKGKILKPKLIIGSFLVIGLILLGYFFVQRFSGSSKSIEKSIAVLPFKNDSPDQENTHFIDGIMEEILINLQTIKDLRVISRTSVEQFRDQSKSIPVISKVLGVNYIVQGSAQKYGNRFRLRMLLTKADKESQLWNKTYEQELVEAKDIFAIQSQIAQSIATELQAVITPTEKQLIEKTPTKNLSAYDDYLNGQFYWRKLTRADLESAKKYFELAMQKDPHYALAYAGISDTWIALAQTGFVSPVDAGPKAISSLMKALELDSTLAQVHYSLGLLMYASEWDWKKSESEFQKALTINSNLAEAHSSYSSLLDITGRHEEAQEQIEMAVKLDPYNPLIKSLYAIHLLFTSKYADALNASEEALLMDPTNPVGLFANAFALHSTGRFAEALNIWKESYLNNYKGYKHIVHAFDQGYAKAGYIGALKMEADTLAVQLKGSYYNPTDISTLYLVAGDKKRAVEFLAEAFKAHDPNLIYVLLPLYDNIRSEPSFQSLCRQMNLPSR
jgi:TolB-like protein